MYNPQLETFLRVADAGSFNKAADELFITPPAVIKQITSLESSLDMQLFIRSHRGLALTEAGKSIYRDAKYIIQYCKEAEIRARNAAQEGDRVIRIGTSPMTPGQFLLDLWPRIHEYCPDIKFKLVPYENTPENAREILSHMGEGIDIVAGPFDQRALRDWQCDALELSREPGAVRGIRLPPPGRQGTADRSGPAWGELPPDPPGVEPLSGPDAGRPVAGAPPDPYCGL